MDVDDSNALMLPAKKKVKEKAKTQIKCRENKKLSKSQKRKLKRLAEEKEKEQLLSKSLEALEKYQISEDAYSLLWSSQKIGQAETMRDKWRRDMHLSKAGLEVPDNYLHPKRRKIVSCEREIDARGSSIRDIADKNATSQSVVIEKAEKKGTPVLAVPSQVSVVQRDSGDHAGSGLNKFLKEGAGKDTCKGMQLDAGNSSLCCSPDNVKKISTAVDGLIGQKSTDLSRLKCSGDDSVPPTVVHVSRPKEVEDGRKDLPIIMMEQEIMEAINEHISVIICGETGCGKTTQIPQFLYEAGYGSKGCSSRSGVIGITQPRRVAVLSTAKRVAYELGLGLGKEVGFQVRHDKRIGENCSVKFMTDGILLRELQSDFLLKHYSVIILDEAHERSLNTDILVGMLSRVMRQRQAMYEDQKQRVLAGEVIKPDNRIFPLKLILMSATLRVKDFISGGRVFDEPPRIIDIPTRQFPVTKHFSKKTELVDYVGEAFKKVLKIHKRLPPGGILVFVTGQREVEYLCRKLRKASKQFARSSEVKKEDETATGTDLDKIDGYDMEEINEAFDTHERSTELLTDKISCYDDYHDESDRSDCHDESDDSDSYSSCDSGIDSELETESGTQDLADKKNAKVDDNIADYLGDDVNIDSLKAAFEALTGKTASLLESGDTAINSSSPDICSSESFPNPNEENRAEKDLVGPMHVLPLYAMLPAAAQLRVFEEVKEGERLVVIATNVAETSLTIPGIKYVVDTGREKVKKYNSSNGMESYEIQWISKASAAQRAGRAGRTGPGHCYCLYSSAALTNQFPEFSCPEISKIPVDGVVLLMKSMGISKVANFPFPTPPDAKALVEAERCLKALEALNSEGRLTPLGKTMALYPMSPRHSRLLLLAIQIMKKEIAHLRPNLVLGYAVAAAAALSLSNPFLLHLDGSRSNAEGSQENRDQQDKLMRKRMKEIAKLSRAKFSNLRSDALTLTYALQCFEQSENPLKFCSENALHLKTMEDMSKLRKQLLHLVFNQRFSGLQQEFSWSHGTVHDVENNWRVVSDKNPLSQVEEDVLCQAICAGWADRVAKRVRGTSGLTDGDRKVNAVRYQASAIKETVFLRRWSSISRCAPEFLVYSELLHTKRPYIHGATSVEPEWLVKYAGNLCTYSAPLVDPKPFYDPLRDQVFCAVTPFFGPHLWELPPCKVPMTNVEQRVAVFAYAFLDGHILPCLKSARNFMASPPSSVLRAEALGQKRVGELLSKLKSRKRTIDSCAMLREAWKENPRQLHPEILGWFQDGFRGLFEELWANMQREALLPPEDRFPDMITKKKKKKKKQGPRGTGRRELQISG